MHGASTMRIPPAALGFGLGGVVPFVAAALLQWGAVPAIPPETARLAGIAYGAVVLSFLGGIRWGAALLPAAARQQAWQLAGSALPALAGWLALLLPPIPAVCLLISALLMQALWDVASSEDGRLPPWFGRLRMLLTAGAVLALMAMLLRLLT